MLLLNNMNSRILEKLKEKRREIALREGKELFKIFSNAILEATAEILPKTKEELTQIKGWGKKRIEKYGDEILAIINESNPDEQLTGKLPSRAEKIFSVQELIKYLNQLFTPLGVLKVRGEITEVSRHPNGYCFFTIKDSQVDGHSISCYVNSWRFMEVGYLIEEGMDVVINAIPSLYKNGRFNLVVNNVEPYGEGALKKAFEILKRKLEAKGYFDQQRKKPIPQFVKKIGVITSESGAAIRDFIKNLGNYGFEIYLVDARVEGDYAEQSIVSAIHWLNKNVPELDVIALIRGGGGLEELKAFNSERVADAIILSRLPVITGIGHERDITIADFCADRRLSTPSMAAAFLRRQKEALIEQINKFMSDLLAFFSFLLDGAKSDLDYKQSKIETAFKYLINKQRLRLSKIAEQMHSGFSKMFRQFKELDHKFLTFLYNYERKIAAYFHQLDIITHKCLNLLEREINKKLDWLASKESVLNSLNPEAVLQRGYSITYKAGGQIVKSAEEVEEKDKILIKLYDGELTSRVTKIRKIKNN